MNFWVNETRPRRRDRASSAASARAALRARAPCCIRRPASPSPSPHRRSARSRRRSGRLCSSSLAKRAGLHAHRAAAALHQGSHRRARNAERERERPPCLRLPTRPTSSSLRRSATASSDTMQSFGKVDMPARRAGAGRALRPRGSHARESRQEAAARLLRQGGQDAVCERCSRDCGWRLPVDDDQNKEPRRANPMSKACCRKRNAPSTGYSL